MSEKLFFGSILYNPNYLELQREVLSDLVVSDTPLPLPERFQERFSKQINHYLPQEPIRLSLFGQRLCFYEQSNGITRLITTPTLIDYCVDQYIYFDRDTKRWWDPFQLLQNLPSSPLFPFSVDQTEVFNTSKNGYIPYGNGGKILFTFLTNQSSIQSVPPEFREISKNYRLLELVDALVFIHEAGHRLQIYGNIPEEGWAVAKERSRDLLLRYVLQKPLLARLLCLIPGARNRMELIRDAYRWRERNAWAFTFQVIRVLRDQGLDICKGYSSEEILYVAETMLTSYDRVLFPVPDKPFSKRLSSSKV